MRKTRRDSHPRRGTQRRVTGDWKYSQTGTTLPHRTVLRKTKIQDQSMGPC